MGLLVIARRLWNSVSLPVRGIIVGVALALIVITVLSIKLQHARALTREAGLNATNEAAKHDTLKTVTLSTKDSAALKLGDSIAVLTQLVQQTKQSKDAVDRALKSERTSTTALRATIKELSARVQSNAAPVEDTTTHERRASFDVRETPYTAHADVMLPAPGSGPGSLALTVRLDTARVTATIGCSQANRFGIRPATLSLRASSWLTLHVDSVSQAPETCANAAPVIDASHWWEPALTIGIGTVYDVNHKRLHAGPSMTLGWSFHPFGR